MRSAVWTACIALTALVSAAAGSSAQPAPDPPPFGVLPGEFAIRNFLTRTFVTARDGGQHSNDALITSATAIGQNEKFQIERLPPNAAAFRTLRGFYVSAPSNFGADASATMQTERTAISDDARFKVFGPGATGIQSIMTFRGRFLTAVDGGGRTAGAFFAAATQARQWEFFRLVKCGDLGSAYVYGISPVPSGFIPQTGTELALFLSATSGGNKTAGAMTANQGLQNPNSRFRLIKQADGTYGIETPNRRNFLTAVDGGGLKGGINLQTNRTSVRDWEKFRIVDQGDCTYTIQTSKNWFLAANTAGLISTRITYPKEALAETGYSGLFEFVMVGIGPERPE